MRRLRNILNSSRRLQWGVLLGCMAVFLMALAPTVMGNILEIDSLGTIWTPTLRDPVGQFIRIDISDAGGANIYLGNQPNVIGVVEHEIGANTALTGNAARALTAWYNDLGRDGGAIATLDTRGQFQSSTPITYDCIYVNSVMQAGVTYGGGIGPDQRVTFKDIRSRVRTAGVTGAGPQNAILRITDGTSACDCPFSCTTAIGPMSAACAGTVDLDGGSTCTFIGLSHFTYGISSIGNCSPAPDLQGCATVDAVWAINPGF